jgi:hypothetical protein
MASTSVKSSLSPLAVRTTTTGLRRIKSHEPGQRVMTEAIALLFSYYTPKDALPPTPEEFFNYLRHLQQQSYAILVPGPRRKVSSKLLGGALNSAPFSNHYTLLDSIEPLPKNGRTLVNSIVQAHAIGMRALTTYCALVQDDSDNMLRTHIAEPFVWFANQLYHDLLNFHEKGLGLTLSLIHEGIAYLNENISRGSKLRLNIFYGTYSKYFDSYSAEQIEQLRKYLVIKLDSAGGD